jgi:hypothetical protein
VVGGSLGGAGSWPVGAGSGEVLVDGGGDDGSLLGHCWGDTDGRADPLVSGAALALGAAAVTGG